MRLNQALIALLLIITCHPARAMDDVNFFNVNLFDAQDFAYNQPPATQVEANPVFKPSLLPPPQQSSALPPKPTQLKRYNATTNVRNHSKGKNPFLEPPKKKSLLDDSDDSEEVEYMPLPTLTHSAPPAKPPVEIEDTPKRIAADLEKAALRAFTYDIEGMKILNERAHDITIMCLQLLRQKDKDFLHRLNFNKGTPDIMRYIEKIGYPYPENIAVRTKQYPHASSLASLACCTEYNIKELKNCLINQEYPWKHQRDKVSDMTPTPTTLIGNAILAYLEQLDAAANETPKERRKRIYKNAYNLYNGGDL